MKLSSPGVPVAAELPDLSCAGSGMTAIGWRESGGGDAHAFSVQAEDGRNYICVVCGTYIHLRYSRFAVCPHI